MELPHAPSGKESEMAEFKTSERVEWQPVVQWKVQWNSNNAQQLQSQSQRRSHAQNTEKQANRQWKPPCFAAGTMYLYVIRHYWHIADCCCFIDGVFC
jgi:hypothetical protein